MSASRPLSLAPCLVAAGLALVGHAYAASPLDSALEPHTTRTIHVRDAGPSSWQFAIHPITQRELLHFTAEDSTPIPTDTFMPVEADFRYGFSFDPGADFDIVYAVSAVHRDGPAATRGNPKCVFLFSGLEPAVPQNQVVNLAGAACSLERDASGRLLLVLAHD